MKERNQRGLAAGLALALGMGMAAGGCSGGSSGGGSTTTQSVSGSVVANTVNGAVVRVYQINADRSLTFLVEGATEADGTYTLDAPGTGPFYVVAGGGSYQDEATALTRSLGGLPDDASALNSLDQGLNGVLRAVVGESEASGARTIGLNPLTTLAAQRTIAASQTDGGALSEANVAATSQLLASEFGVSGDPRTIDPLDFTSSADAGAIANGSSSPEAQLGAVLAALSQSAEDQGLAEPLALIDALAADFSDGTLDGQAGGSAIQVNGGGTLSSTAGTSDLSGSLTNFLNDTSVNASGTTAETFTDLVEAVDSQDVAPAGVNLRPNVDAIADQSVSLDAGQQTISVSGIDAGGDETGQTVSVSLQTTGSAISDVTLAGEGATRTITYTPAAAGTSTLTLTVSDDGGSENGGVDTFSRSFTVTVSEVAPPAPTPTVGIWTRSLARAGEEGLVGIAAASSGTYVVGYTRGTTSTLSASGYDVYVALYASDGSLVFERQVADTGMDSVHDMAIDDAGNLFVVGDSDGSLNTIGGPALNGLLLRLSGADGSVLAATTLGGNTGKAVAVLGGASPIVVVGGEVNTDGSGLDGYVQILDESGNQTGSNAISATGDQTVTGVSIDPQNGIAVAITTFGNLGAEPQGNGDPAVRKISFDGSTSWTRQIGSDQVDTTTRVLIGGNGEVTVVGHTLGVLGQASAGATDAFVWRLDSGGTTQSVFQFGTTGDDQIHGLAGDVASIVVGGSTTGSLQAANLGGSDAWLRRLDGTNQTTGSARLGGGGDDALRALTFDTTGGVTAAGDSTGTFNGAANAGGLDGWVVRLGNLVN